MSDGNSETATPPVDSSPISPHRPEAASSLEKHLQQRPERQELVDRNILPSSSAAPGLQAQQKELARHMRADSLNDKIAHRPTPEALLKDGVLHEDPRSLDESQAGAVEEEPAKKEGEA
jgi:hypothetical protein